MDLDSAYWLRRLGDPGDRLATGAFAREHLPRLVNWLQRRYADADPDLVQEAAGEALVTFLKDPGKYNPARRSLSGYLGMLAYGDLLNLIRRERRQRIKTSDPVALDELAGNKIRDDFLCVEDFPALVAVRDSLPEQDRAVYELIRQGERKDPAFAAVLGFTDRPAKEQRKEIKRVKDRIVAKFRRAARGIRL
jgi:hypothetical protein